MIDDRLPLYIQIKKYLKDSIQRGIYKANDQIPSEQELAKKFNVSRITSKNAILQLVEQGLVYRIPGKGTFVKDIKAEEAVNESREEQRNALQSSKIIGIIMPEVVERHSAQILAEIESAVSERGYGLLLRQSHHSTEKENQAMNMMMKEKVEGLIIFPVDDVVYNEKILQLSLDKFPLVLIDRYLKGIETAAVYSDNYHGAYELTKILLDQGHQKISLFTSPHYHTVTVEERIKGYEQALTDARIPIDRSLRFVDILQQEDPVEKAIEFLSAHSEITSIFAMNAFAGKIAIQAAKKLKDKLPKNFAIASFDQDQTLDFFPVYSAKQDPIKIGQKAVELLYRQVKGEEIGERVTIPIEIETISTTESKNLKARDSS